ncbi:MAG: MCE family protein [Nitrosomonadales bacterium]|nr:MCE family protein [Nitrosomonadales bacterium]
MKLFSDHDSRLAILERKVGLFVFTVMGVLMLVFVSVAIEQGMFASTTRLRFHPDDASSLYAGMKVKLNGFNVGKLSDISLLDNGVVEVRFVVEDRYLSHIGNGAKVRLATSSLFGDSALEIVPGTRGAAAFEDDDLLPFERQVGVSDLARDLADRIKPILDNLQVTTEKVNQPGGLLDHAQEVAVQLEETGRSATQLMRRTEDVIATGSLKLTNVLDKSDRVLDKVHGIALDAAKVTAVSAENIPAMMRDGRAVAEDARNIIGSAKESWPIRNFIEPGEEKLLPMDSYGVSDAPAE